ncbi:MAG: DUF4388 domain-containing protein [Bdellovibrionales bacterium]|nr:DUF4388 domain-containing protein [Bdellovibrionales bacterium]
MKFKGEIHNFSVLDLLHYLNAHEETGILTITSPTGEVSELYFDKGQCVRSKYEGMSNIGEMLVSQGKINQAQIDIALTERQKQKIAKPFGQVLQDCGFVSKDDIRQVMTQQIEDGLHRLMKLNSGLFRFKHTEALGVDDIGLQFNDLVLPEEINTAYVLVDAISRFDKEQDDTGEDEENNEPIDTSSDQIRFAISLLKLMMTDARKIEQSSNILKLFLNVLSEYAPRAGLFTLSDDTFMGVGGFGKTQDGQLLNDVIRKMKCSLPDNPTLLALMENRETACVDSLNEPWVQSIHEAIGKPMNSQILILPIGGVESVTAFAYADMGDREDKFLDIDLLDLAAAQTGVLVENTYIRKLVKTLQRRSIH